MTTFTQINSLTQNCLEQLIESSQNRFNGELEFCQANGKNIKFYYRFGRVIWATSNCHPTRRLWRQLTTICPQFDLSKVDFSQVNLSYSFAWDYQILDFLVKQKQITAHQVHNITTAILQELLFDLIFYSENSLVTSQIDLAINPELILSFCNSENLINLIDQANQNWLNWCQINPAITSISPNFAPLISQPNLAQQKINLQSYQKLSILSSGKWTIRDLAVKTSQNSHQLMRSLLPYLQKQIIKMIDIADLNLFKIEVKNNLNDPKETIAQKPYLIACIDDSPQINKTIEQVVKKAGFNFLGIDNPIKALPILIESKPDLIFLDVMMPIANGYEICTQLRRTQIFQQTPIVILTGNDTLVDRVKAKISGATDFISKTNINTKRFLGIVNKYLATQA